jgi:hypothetical protein
MLVIEIDAESGKHPDSGPAGMSGVEQRVAFQRQLEQPVSA